MGISIASGACFALLVFSNLYVWTAALAWLVIFTLLWLASQENGRASFVKHLAIAEAFLQSWQLQRTVH